MVVAYIGILRKNPHSNGEREYAQRFSTPTGSSGAAASAAPTSAKNKRKTRWLDFTCELAAERAE